MTTAEKLTAIAQNQQQVYEAGKAAGEFDWDAFQVNGNRANYEHAFVYNWTDDNYAPKHPIIGKLTQAFYMSQISNVKMPLVATGAFNSVFQSSSVVIIPRLDLSGVTSIFNAFYGAKQITSILFTGLIRVNGLDVSPCPKLTKQSLVSLLNCLEDKTGDTSGTQWVVTIGATNKAKLTAAELARAEDKGWTVK